MRKLVAFLILTCGVGCHTFQCPKCPCPASSDVCADRPSEASHPSRHAVCESLPAASPACMQSAPAIEVRPAETIHVTAPPQRVVVNAPAAEVATQQPTFFQATQAMTPAFAPQAAAFTPVGVASVPTAMQPASAPVNMVASSVQTTTTPRARLALGLDTFQINLPFPRFYAVPGPQRVTTETQYATVAGPATAAVQPVQYVQQAAASVPSFQTAGLVAAPIAAAVPMQAAAPVAAYVAVPSTAAVSVQCPPRATTETIAEFDRQLQAVKKLLDQKDAAAAQQNGTPLPPINK